MWQGSTRPAAARNRARDIAAAEALTARGWRTGAVWECELKDTPALSARLERLLQ